MTSKTDLKTSFLVCQSQFTNCLTTLLSPKCVIDDNSRVVLDIIDDDDSSDYINASYIDVCLWNGIVSNCYCFIVYPCRGTIDPTHTLQHKVHNMFVPDLIITILFAIFTIGPLRNTISDLWRMIWQYKLRTVIMLTETVEAGRVNTCKYHTVIIYILVYSSPTTSSPPQTNKQTNKEEYLPTISLNFLFQN